MRNKGRQKRSRLTVNGRITLTRIKWHCPTEGTATPCDELIDIADEAFSRGVREMACRLSVSRSSFKKTSDDLTRTAQFYVDRESLRKLVLAEGKAVQRESQSGALRPAWDATQCKTENGETRVYMSCDGVQIPTITDDEKKKRRKDVRARRRRSGKKRKPLPRRKQGADGPWKEAKVIAHYDESHARWHVSATRGDREAAGRIMRRDATMLRLREADQRIANIDGAPWIRNQIELHGVVENIGLDFYHLSEHVHSARREVFGEKSGEGERWATDVLHRFKHEGYASAWDRIVPLRTRFRKKSKHKAVDELLGYMSRRREMIRYPEFLANGWQIGSGPIESQCKTTTERVKGAGKRWDPDNAEAVMALACLHNSGLWKKRWLTPSSPNT